MQRVMRLVLAPALLAVVFVSASADTADAQWVRYGSHYGYGYSHYHPGGYVDSWSPHYSVYYPVAPVRRVYAYPAYRAYSYPAYYGGYGGYGVRSYYGGYGGYGGHYCW